MNYSEKFLAAQKLLTGDSTSKEMLDQVRILIKGLNPKVDQALSNCEKAISQIENLLQGDVIELSADNLPEGTDKEKKRKEAILFFLKNYRDLKTEIDRATNELESADDKSLDQNVQSVGKLLTSPKGAFGLVTVAAIVMAAVFVMTRPATKSSEPIVKTSAQESEKIQVIDVGGKKIPLTELKTGIGRECKTGNQEASHYHAKDGASAQATDKFQVADPGGCGFGKVDEVKVEEIEISP